jgi:hypothetical protein
MTIENRSNVRYEHMIDVHLVVCSNEKLRRHWNERNTSIVVVVIDAMSPVHGQVEWCRWVQPCCRFTRCQLTFMLTIVKRMSTWTALLASIVSVSTARDLSTDWEHRLWKTRSMSSDILLSYHTHIKLIDPIKFDDASTCSRVCSISNDDRCWTLCRVMRITR